MQPTKATTLFRARSFAVVALAAATSCFSLSARSEMYICSRAEGGPVLRNMPCAPQERTVSINGLPPQEWERRTAQKALIEARAVEDAARQAEGYRRTAQSQEPTTLGGFAESVRKLTGAGQIGLKAVLDPTGAASTILENNKPKGR